MVLSRVIFCCFFFFKQKTAYELRISDWEFRRVLFRSEWHAWLHHTVDDAPVHGVEHKPWEKEHLPNLSGTPFAYKPPGSVARGGHRPHATGDYQAWQPE